MQHTGWRKKRGHPISLQIFWKLHDRIVWKIVSFCNIICRRQSLTYLFENFIALWRHLAKTQLLCDAQSICTVWINDSSCVFAIWRHSAMKFLNKKLMTVFSIEYYRSSPISTQFGHGISEYLQWDGGPVFFWRHPVVDMLCCATVKRRTLRVWEWRPVTGTLWLTQHLKRLMLTLQRRLSFACRISSI